MKAVRFSIYLCYLLTCLALQELNNCLQTEQEHTSNLITQLRENKESTSKWVFTSLYPWPFQFQILNLVLKNVLHACRELTESVEENTQLRKQVSDLTVLNQQQVGVREGCIFNNWDCLAWLQSQTPVRKIKPNCLFILQASKIVALEENLKCENETIKGLEQKTEQGKVSTNK